MDNNINRHLPSHVSGTSGSMPAHSGNNSPLHRAHAGPSRSIQHTDSPSRRQQQTGNHPLANATAGSSRSRARETHSAHPAHMRYMDPLDVALGLIRTEGMTELITASIVHIGYSQAAKVVVGGKSVSHLCSFGTLESALGTAIGRLRKHSYLSDVQKFAELSDSLGGSIARSTLDRVMDATELSEVDSAIKAFCNYRKNKKIGFQPNTVGNQNFVDVPLPEALRTLILAAKDKARIPPDATECTSGELSHYKRLIPPILADYSIFHLLETLKTNLANIFVQQHTDIGDRAMGINIKAIIETRKMQDTIKAIDGGSQPLPEVMTTYLGNLQNQHDHLVATLPFKGTAQAQAAARMAARERLASGLSVHDAQIKLVLQKLEGPQPPVEEVRAELKSIVTAYEDSFHFDYAKGPHHELNHDMNTVMGPIYASLKDFASSSSKTPVTAIFPALKQMIAAHNDVLKNFGVTEPRRKMFLYSRRNPVLELTRHILLNTPLPSGFVPYKCTQRYEFLDVLPRFDGGPLRIRAGSTAAVHQDYTGEVYQDLLEQVAVEFLLRHSQEQVDRAPHTLTHAFRFDHKGREYRFAYRIETDPANGTDHITQAQLSVFSPNKINEKIIVKLMSPDYRWPQLDEAVPQDRGERH